MEAYQCESVSKMHIRISQRNSRYRALFERSQCVPTLPSFTQTAQK